LSSIPWGGGVYKRMQGGVMRSEKNGGKMQRMPEMKKTMASEAEKTTGEEKTEIKRSMMTGRRKTETGWGKDPDEPPCSSGRSGKKKIGRTWVAGATQRRNRRKQSVTRHRVDSDARPNRGGCGGAGDGVRGNSSCVDQGSEVRDFSRKSEN